MSVPKNVLLTRIALEARRSQRESERALQRLDSLSSQLDAHAPTPDVTQAQASIAAVSEALQATIDVAAAEPPTDPTVSDLPQP